MGDAHNALGLFYYFCLQDFERALLELDEARKRSPNDGNVIFYTALVKRRQGKLDEAIELVKQATIFDPRNPDMWVNLGRSYRGMRDFRRAREMFDRAFAVSPETEFIAEKAETYRAEGDLDGAENLLRGQDVTGNERILGEYVSCLVDRRHFDEAVQTVSKAFEKKSSPPFRAADNKSWLGLLKLWAGQKSEGHVLVEEARRELMALREQGETSWHVSEALLWTTATLGDRPAVEREAAAILARTQRDSWRAPGAKEVVASAYSLLGDADHAIPLLEQVLSMPYHHSITPALLRQDPLWDPIRNDQRFQKLDRVR